MPSSSHAALASKKGCGPPWRPSSNAEHAEWQIPYGARISEGWITPEDIARPLLSGKLPPGMPNFKPDVPMNRKDLRYVSGYIMPYHFKHPVTGQKTSEALRNKRLKPIKP